jgi:hypothetical protein
LSEHMHLDFRVFAFAFDTWTFGFCRPGRLARDVTVSDQSKPASNNRN